MLLRITQHRSDQGWYEKYVMEKTSELIHHLNESDEGKKRKPSKLFDLIKVICHHPEQTDIMVCAFDETVLEIYMVRDKTVFIKIEFTNEQTLERA